jgi:hypothetical protein
VKEQQQGTKGKQNNDRCKEAESRNNNKNEWGNESGGGRKEEEENPGGEAFGSDGRSEAGKAERSRRRTAVARSQQFRRASEGDFRARGGRRGASKTQRRRGEARHMHPTVLRGGWRCGGLSGSALRRDDGRRGWRPTRRGDRAGAPTLLCECVRTPVRTYARAHGRPRTRARPQVRARTRPRTFLRHGLCRGALVDEARGAHALRDLRAASLSR